MLGAMSTERTTQSAPIGEMPSSAQLILGADKRNPVFTVYRDSERERLEVYFGFEIIEALPDVPESPACKLLLARLYNAGVKVKSLTETFGFDAKTIRRWGQSLRRGDAEELIRVSDLSKTGKFVWEDVEVQFREKGRESWQSAQRFSERFLSPTPSVCSQVFSGASSKCSRISDLDPRRKRSLRCAPLGKRISHRLSPSSTPLTIRLMAGA